MTATMKSIKPEEFLAVLKKWHSTDQEILVTTSGVSENSSLWRCKITNVGVERFWVTCEKDVPHDFWYGGGKLAISEDGCSLRVNFTNSKVMTLIEKSYSMGE